MIAVLALFFYFIIYRNPDRLKIAKQLTGNLFQKPMTREEKQTYDKFYKEEYDQVSKEEIEKKARADARREAKKRYGSDKE